MISGGRKASESSERILHTMRVASRPEPFLVVTPDTVVMSDFHLDMDSLRRHFQHSDQGRERVMVNMNGLIRRIAEQREDVSRQHVMIPMPEMRVTGDSDFISIQFGSGWEEMSVPMPDLWVKPRHPGRFGTTGRQRVPSPFGGDSSFYFNFRFNDIDLDSVVERMMKGGVPPGFEFLMRDIRGNEGRPQMNAGKLKRALDSAFLAKKGGRSKLDSLMREMDKRELRRLQGLGEKDTQD
jgi:hypothetical protein